MYVLRVRKQQTENLKKYEWNEKKKKKQISLKDILYNIYEYSLKDRQWFLISDLNTDKQLGQYKCNKLIKQKKN